MYKKARKESRVSSLITTVQTLKLHGPTGRVDTNSAELSHRTRDAVKTACGTEIPLALEEAGDGVRCGGWGVRGGELVVGGGGSGWVDEGSEHRIDVALVDWTLHISILRAATIHQRLYGWCRWGGKGEEGGKEEEDWVMNHFAERHGYVDNDKRIVVMIMWL